MSAPTKIRATTKDGLTEVRVLMQHEMDNGRRKDEAGNLIPAWYITDVTARHNGRVVLEGEFGTSVSKNPYLVFRFRGGAVGDKVSISWQDNKGETRSDEVSII
jgi:sulfur-oxidizing protein SoxZ